MGTAAGIEELPQPLQWKDWCPLCGRRFRAPTAEALMVQIILHVEDGSCERGLRPFEVALADDHF